MTAQFEDLAMELRTRTHERGWVGYRGWRGVADVDQGESLERQLHEMRNDPPVVKILMKAAQLVDRSATRSYVFESWEPELR